MSKREEKIEGSNHMTPRDVAVYMRSEGAYVGRSYETHGDVWNAEHQVLQTGLLHLILDQLEAQGKCKKDPLDGHGFWLGAWHKHLQIQIATYVKQRQRLVEMFRTEKIARDMSRYFSIHSFSLLWRHNQPGHLSRYIELNESIEMLRSVRTPSDATKLDGIGKKTAAKLIESLKSKSL